jgi:hypothetical protein
LADTRGDLGAPEIEATTATMSRVILICVLIAAFLAYAKNEQYFERAGIVHTCKPIAAPAGQDGDWQSCEQGLIDGFPDLSLDACERMGRTTGREFWRCPVPLTNGFSP